MKSKRPGQVTLLKRGKHILRKHITAEQLSDQTSSFTSFTTIIIIIAIRSTRLNQTMDGKGIYLLYPISLFDFQPIRHPAFNALSRLESTSYRRTARTEIKHIWYQTLCSSKCSSSIRLLACAYGPGFTRPLQDGGVCFGISRHKLFVLVWLKFWREDRPRRIPVERVRCIHTREIRG